MEVTRKSRIVMLLILLSFSSITCRVDDETDSKEGDLFVPTQDWQIVREGQVLPKGLHIRINLQTRQKEAKLINLYEKTNALLAVNADQEDPVNLENRKASKYRLKEALKNIKSDEPSIDQHKQKRNEFRTYEQLKQELRDINFDPKSESEVLKLLLKKFKELTNLKVVDTQHVLSVVEDIDFLVHQFDNAIDFVRLNGFEDVIYKNLNSTNKDIKLEILKLLGALVQNNVKVQIHAIETGALDYLLRMLVLNSDYAVKNRVVFALSGLIRRFPLAQAKFVENGGLNVFLELISKSTNIKIQLKIITLINDLVLEYIDALDDHSNTEKTAQYNSIDIKNKLVEINWCEHLTTVFKNVYEIDKSDHDGFEKSLNAILSVADNCKISQLDNIQTILKDLQVKYSALASTGTLAKDEHDVGYFKHMESLCSAIINYNNVIKRIKTEL